MQSFPTAAIIDGPDLDDMGQKKLSARVEKLAGEVTAIKNELKLLSDNSRVGKRDVGLYVALASLALTMIGLPIMLLSWIEPHLQNDLKNDVKLEVTDQLKEPLKQIGEIAGDIKEIKGKLEVLDPLVRELTIKRMREAENLSPKELQARLPELKRLANVARTENVLLSPETVQKVGKKLIENGGEEAWSTAIDFLNYKSFLNVSLSVAVNNVLGTGTLTTQYRTSSPPGMAPPQFSVAGAVPMEQAAQLLQIGSQDLNSSSPLGNDWIVVTGGSMVIDDMQMRKVIFRNVYISYSGGPLKMQSVYFINCTFGVAHGPNGQGLITATLKPSPITSFDAS